MSGLQARQTMIDFDRDTALTGKMLAALNLRAEAAQRNIANQNTPGYKRQEVVFEELLRDALAKGEDTNRVNARVVRDDSGEPGQNNVDLVKETATLDKVRLLHEFVTRRAGSYFGTLNKAIFGR